MFCQLWLIIPESTQIAVLLKTKSETECRTHFFRVSQEKITQLINYRAHKMMASVDICAEKNHPYKTAELIACYISVETSSAT